MVILFFRTIIVYSLVIFSLRIMGKRQVGELQPSELVVAIMISDLATMPMSDVSTPLLYGIVPIFTLVICEVLLSFVSLKSEKIRVFLSGKPQILVKNGVIQRKELMHARVNTDDLLEELRKAGFFSLSDIDTVILETGGCISVIPTSDASVPTVGNMKLNVNQSIIPYIYIADGQLRKNELKRANKSIKWLESYLAGKGVSSVKDVFMFSQDGDGKIFFQKKDDKK